MEAYLCRGRYIVNLKYDWLVMMSLGGAVVSFYHETSWSIRRNPVSELRLWLTFGHRLWLDFGDFGTLGYR